MKGVGKAVREVNAVSLASAMARHFGDAILLIPYFLTG